MIDRTVGIRQVLERHESTTGQYISYLWTSSNHVIQSWVANWPNLVQPRSSWDEVKCVYTKHMVKLVQENIYLLNRLFHMVWSTQKLSAAAFELPFGVRR